MRGAVEDAERVQKMMARWARHRTTHHLRGFHPFGKHAHGLHTDLKTALGPWVVFASGEVLERALVYLGMTSEQLEHHRDSMRRWGQETSRLTLQPHRKNLP
jgi:hypothetical protein